MERQYRLPRSVALISGIAITLATFGFVAGFWVSYDFNIFGAYTFIVIPFAIVAGCVPLLCAVAGAWIAWLAANSR